MSADEIDAELLAMAGDSSDEEADELDQLQDTQEHNSNDGEQTDSGVHRTTEAPPRTKGVAQKVKARGRRQRKRSESDIDDDNDLDRSPSPAMSSDAGALDESDADSDGAGDYDEEAPLFPLEGKFENARDREIIMAMNEIEREEVLADRAAQVLRRQQDIQLKKALADGRASASKQKRKALAAELDEGARRNTRPKTDKRSALDDYRRAREQKGAERSRTDQHRPDRDDFSPSARSDNDAEGESEVEWADPVSDSRREETPTELKDFERCRVGRSNFAKVCFYPGFEEAIKGCFCRVNIGPNKENGQAQYRMTQIKGKQVMRFDGEPTSNTAIKASPRDGLIPWRHLPASDSSPINLPLSPKEPTRNHSHFLLARMGILQRRNSRVSKRRYPRLICACHRANSWRPNLSAYMVCSTPTSPRIRFN